MTGKTAKEVAAKRRKPLRVLAKADRKIKRRLPLICNMEKVRIAAGISQEDVCQALHLASISYIENGGNLRLELAFRIAAFFEVGLLDLWPGTKETRR